jgi:hypothetical protein
MNSIRSWKVKVSAGAAKSNYPKKRTEYQPLPESSLDQTSMLRGSRLTSLDCGEGDVVAVDDQGVACELEILL